MARAVADEKPGAAFTLIGNANLDFVAALTEFEKVPQFKGRIEGAVVTMAEGYARTSGEVAVASITAGPGLANATNALCCAVRNKVPLVLVTGQPDRTHRQYFNQEAFADFVGAEYVEAVGADVALEAVRTAFYVARAESRTVILDIPRSVAAADFPWGYEYRPSTADVMPERRVPPEQASIKATLDLIAASTNPVIIAGRGAHQSGARSAILEFGAEIGALLGTSLLVKNWFADDPHDLGVCGLFSARHSIEILSEADLVLGIGASLNDFTVVGGYLLPEAKIVQIDVALQLRNGTGNPPDCYVNGDAKATVEALTTAVRAASVGGVRFRTAEVRDRIAQGKAAGDPATFELEPDRGTDDV